MTWFMAFWSNVSIFFFGSTMLPSAFWYVLASMACVMAFIFSILIFVAIAYRITRVKIVAGGIATTLTIAFLPVALLPIIHEAQFRICSTETIVTDEKTVTKLSCSDRENVTDEFPPARVLSETFEWHY